MSRYNNRNINRLYIIKIIIWPILRRINKIYHFLIGKPTHIEEIVSNVMMLERKYSKYKRLPANKVERVGYTRESFIDNVVLGKVNNKTVIVE